MRSAEGSSAGAFVRTAASFGLAVSKHQLGELGPAESGLVRVLLEAPDHPVAPAAALALASTLAAGGKAHEAEARFSWVLSLGTAPRLALPARYGKTRLLAERGDIEAAEECARGFPPDAEPFWRASALLAVGWGRFERGQPELALPAFEEARLLPSDAAALASYMAGASLYALGRLPEA
ncbi:MAG: tetratricopeptide repeat protein, partial [Deltaproteobacteria bacterium]|nr:tetratricopeptide repeat protein [Deltaproteobacteria bacterium]